MKAALYIRVSTQKQAEKYSLPSQEKILIDYCTSQGWEYEIYNEGGVSGETIIERPQMIRLLQDIRESKFQIGLAVEMERFSRSERLSDWDTIKEAFKEGNARIGTPTQILDLNDLEDDFLCNLFGVLSTREKKKIVARMKRGKREALRQGKFVGHQVAYGYIVNKGNIEICEPEAKVLKMICNWILEGKTLYAICNELHKRGIKTKTGKPSWRLSTLYNLVTNKSITGNMEVSGIPLRIDPIISMDVFIRIQAQLKRNNLQSLRNAKRIYPLRGLLKCERCGHSICGKSTIKTNNKRYSIYMCVGRREAGNMGKECTLPSVHCDVIENVVWREIVNIIERPDNLLKIVEQQRTSQDVDGIIDEVTLNDIESKIQEKEIEQQRLIKLYRLGKINDKLIDTEYEIIEKEKRKLLKQREDLVKAESRRAQVTASLDLIKKHMDRIKERLHSFSVQDKMNLFQLMIHKIIVNYDETEKKHILKIIGAIPLLDKEIEPESQGQLVFNGRNK